MEAKIRRYLNPETLAWVIRDSISQPKMVSIMSRLQIEYIGVRISSIPAEELAFDLAEEAFSHKEVMDTLIRVLNVENSDEIKTISRMSEAEVNGLLTDILDICMSRRLGNVLWALICDERLIINEFIPRFLNEAKGLIQRHDHIFERMEEEFEKVTRNLTSKKAYRRLLHSMDKLKEDIAREEKISARLMKENERLEEKCRKQQELIHQLQKEYGQLTHQKGELNRLIERKQREIQNLSQLVSKLKEELAVGPKVRLKSEIHRLQKENTKLTYALEKDRQENNIRVNTLERELLKLKQETQELQKVNIALSEELQKERGQTVELQKAYQLISMKKEPTIPKDKGRRLGIFIDNQNVYYSAKMHFGKKLDYQKLLKLLVKDRHLVKAICYIVRHPEVAQEGFINMLKGNGYVVRVRDLIQRADGSAKGNWDIGIAADVMTMIEKNDLDIVTLVTCDGDFADLIKLLSAKGVRVEVVGFSMNMAMDLKETADEYYFLTEDVMIKE